MNEENLQYALQLIAEAIMELQRQTPGVPHMPDLRSRIDEAFFEAQRNNQHD